MSSVPGKLLNPSNIAKKVFDESVDAIRVVGSIGGATAVVIDSASGDNISINHSNGQAITQANPLPVSIEQFNIGEVEIKNDNGNPVPTVAVIDYNPIYVYSEISSVPMGIETVIVSYTVPVGKAAKLNLSEMTGNNIAEYSLYVGAIRVAKKRTQYTDLNAQMTFTNVGYTLTSGQTISLRVKHLRPSLGEFEANLQIKESL